MQSGPEALRQWIDRRRINQREAAKLLQIEYTLLSHYLNSRRRPPLEAAVAIERETGIPVEAWLPIPLGDGDVASASVVGKSRSDNE